MDNMEFNIEDIMDTLGIRDIISKTEDIMVSFLFMRAILVFLKCILILLVYTRVFMY